MNDQSPLTVVDRFNACVNDADLEGLTSMMTDDHVFIDSAGSVMSGRVAAAAAWSSFFSAFPDYRNVFEEVKLTDAIVAAQGHSVCSDPRLNGPALWRAIVTQGKVAQWRVYEDTAENRLALGFPAAATPR